MVLGIGISRGPRISHPRFVSHEEQSPRGLKNSKFQLSLIGADSTRER